MFGKNWRVEHCSEVKIRIPFVGENGRIYTRISTFEKLLEGLRFTIPTLIFLYIYKN